MTNWQKQAACRNADPELFFPIASPGTPHYTAQVSRAKSVCAVCPVREQCLEFALGQPFEGIFGGTTEYERADLARTGVWGRQSSVMEDCRPLVLV